MAMLTRLVVLVLAALTMPALAAAPDPLLEEMRALEATRAAAIRAGDFETLGRLYAPTFRGRTATGEEVDRDALFAIFRRNLGTRVTARSRIERAVRTGELVAATGILELTDPATGQLVGGGTFLHLFRPRRGGGWEMILGRAAPFPLPAAAASEPRR